YLPTRHFGRDRAWKVPETWQMNPRGASCVSIVEFVVLLCDMAGIDGNVFTTAFYAGADKPSAAIQGGLGDPPVYKKGPDDERWQLFVVDDNNSRKGQVGGRGGMNYYEAALALEWKGRKYFYPGGTNRVYDSPDHVIEIFRTLAWATYDFRLEEWVVREV